MNSNHTKGGKVPSTNKLSSRKVAKFLYTFCGIFASFGVVAMLALAGTITNVSAVGNSSNSNTVSATLPGSVAIRLLDSTATSEISSLDFNLTPTASGTSATQSMVVDVATSNPTGYKLYMQSDYQTKDSSGAPTGNYTTNLTHTDPEVADTIPTYVPGSGSGSGTNTLYWNYTNPLTSSITVIPTYGYPDELAELFTTTNSDQTTVPFNVSVDTTIVSGTYENELLFSVVANPTTSTYTLSFDTDGGSMTGGDIVETAMAWTHIIEIPNNSDYIPTKSGYTFDHWLDEATGTTYNPGDSVTITSDESFTGSAELTAVYVTAYSSLAEACNAAPVTTSAGSPYFTYDGVDYIKLYTNSARTTTACYTKNSQGTATWANAGSLCPAGTILPSANDNNGDLDRLVSTYGSDGNLNTVTSWVGDHWSSTPYGNSGTYAWLFYVSSTTVVVTNNTKTSSYKVVCKVASDTIATATYMQDVGYCPDTLTEGTQYTLTDRGETSKTYTVSKLADGKCWMTQNYNRSAGALNTNDYNIDPNTPYSVPTSNCTTTSPQWTDDAGNYYCDSTTISAYASSGYGGYYSYAAATAGTNPSSGDSNYDICPKGWRLPAVTEYETLIEKYSASTAGSNLAQSPVNMKYGGWCGIYYSAVGCPHSAGTVGIYWPSTVDNSTSSFRFDLFSSQAYIDSYYKRYGDSVRCIFR